ncbi:MAG: glycosyltransferase [Opitutaceae bacterium]|jgi:dolichyl-phosphate beta-glucosyltransferase|nr:glycosyltransferase [Opitutaceae bacterium]
MLSIVIPVYNETPRLAASMARLSVALGTLGEPHEVLLVVEASPDGSLALAREIAAQHPGWRAIDNGPQHGKGHAVRSGIRRALGGIVCYMDADLSTDPAAIPQMLALFARHPETALVIGDRRHPQSRVLAAQPRARVRLSLVFNRCVRLLFPGIQTRDTQCGFKAFRASAAAGIFAAQRIDGFAFDVEVLVLASRLGCKLLAMPVDWSDAPHSTVRALRHGSRMALDLLRLRCFPARSMK